jgi:hypothetical protein
MRRRKGQARAQTKAVWSISRDYPGILIYFDFQAVVLGYGIGSGI